MLKFEDHFLEEGPLALKKFSKSKAKVGEQKIALWNAFVDSQLSDITEADCNIYPRILPGSYKLVIEQAARQITEFVMRLVSLPEREVEAIVPQGPIRDFLIKELKVLKYRTPRLVGSFRFDMAIVGEPAPNNPPQLLEINEIGFDGLARMPFIQNTLFDLMPELRKKYFALDTSAAEIRNMKRLGSSLVRFQTDCYNWDEECLLRAAKLHKYDLRLVSPAQYGLKIDKRDFPLLTQEKINVKDGRLSVGNNWRPESYMVSFALSLKDYEQAGKFYAELIRQKTKHYGPFLMGLVASKSILVLLADPKLRRKILGDSNLLSDAILPANMLGDVKSRVEAYPSQYVLKHVDGFGGEQVFMGEELLRNLKKISRREVNHWIIQQRTKLNTLIVDGILSKPKRAICDLGVFVQYDWSQGKFNHFEVGGYLTRATNKSFKVNVSAGGAQVAVMFSKRG